MSEIRTPAEIRAWFDANAGTVAASLVAERAVRAILALHDDAVAMELDDAQPVCREDGQDYDGVDQPGCRTTRAINAEINHVLAGAGIGQSEPTTRAPRPGDTVRLYTERGTVVGRYVLDADDDDRELVEAEKPINGCFVFLVEVNGVRRRMEAVDTPESS
ncbi:MAG TPA: hypothetical protein VGL02_32175 [Streptomyces sp.]